MKKIIIQIVLTEYFTIWELRQDILECRGSIVVRGLKRWLTPKSWSTPEQKSYFFNKAFLQFNIIYFSLKS